MGVSSWMVRRGINSRGFRGGDEDVHLDPRKSTAENLKEVLQNVCKRQGISEEKRVGYLKSFLKIISEQTECGMAKDDFFYCLRPLLVHECMLVRATAWNVVRYLLIDKQDFAVCLKLQYPSLLARSLDLLLRNDSERVQVLIIARRMLTINVQEYPVPLIRSIVANVLSTIDEKDRMVRACLGFLIELCVINPDVFIAAGGVTALIRNLGMMGTARMTESVLGALLYLMNKPETRVKAAINLECLAAPYTDPHTMDAKLNDAGSEPTESRLKRAKTVLVSLLRSWPGVLHFCHPEKEGLKSIVATLYLNQRETRKAVLELLYDLLCLAQPEWSDEISVALEAVDPSRFQDSFRLIEGFVAAEGKAVLPHISRSRVNLAEVHLALLLYSFLEAGLLDAIVEVIVSDDTLLSVRATILLGELLHLIHLLLPPEVCFLTPVIPNLLSYAVRGRPSTRTHRPPYSAQASAATTTHYENFKKDMIMRYRNHKKESICSSAGKPERVRTVSSQSCRSRTVSDSSGERSRLDRTDGGTTIIPAAGTDPARDGGFDPKTTQKTSNILRDVRDVLKDIAENQGDGNSVDGELTDPDSERKPDCLLMNNRAHNKLGGGLLADDCSEGPPIFDPQPFPIPEPPSPNLLDDEILDDTDPIYKDPPFNIRAQQRALTAVYALAKLHRLLRKRPAPATIFLDRLITSIDRKETPTCYDLARAKGRSMSKNKLLQVLSKECDDAIKESGVLSVKDPFAWNWDVIRSILKTKAECFYDSSQRQFLRKLVTFLLPSGRQLTRIDTGQDRKTANIFTLTAFELIDCLLLSPEESECERLLLDLLTAVKAEITSLNSAKSAHDCLLSPHNVMNTLCVDYFLYCGHLSRTTPGRRMLDRVGLFQELLSLVSSTNHDCYVKAIISTLDYSVEGFSRKIMSRVVSSETTGFRLYATKLLHVILRTPIHTNSSISNWVISILVNQLFDKDKAVVKTALDAVDEACDCKEYLEVVVRLNPELDHLGDLGLLLKVRFLSTTDGYLRLLEEGFVTNQLQNWAEHFNFQYVCIIESQLCDSLTLHERGEDGCYVVRSSGNKRTPGDVFVPPHLYGQMAQHESGFKRLMADENISKLVSVVLLNCCRTDHEILVLKAALWALGHVTSSPEGARWARDQRVINAMLHIVRFNQIYSVRATAFYALNITATTTEGANTLRTNGWHTVRHHRHERWPVINSLDILEEPILILDDDQEYSQDSISSNDVEQIGRNGVFYLPKESSISESDNDDYLSQFPAAPRTSGKERSATLPHYSGSAVAGPSVITFHHNRSHSESKADSERMNSPRQSPFAMDSFDPRMNMSIDGLKKNRPSSCGGGSTGSSTDSVQYGKYSLGDRFQTLSPIPSSGSLSTIKYATGGVNPQQRRTSVAASSTSHNSTRLSHQDAIGYATLRYLHRGRRPVSSPMPALSPLSPIELIAFQDLKQISPLVRPRHSIAQPLMSEFDVQGIKCRLLSDVTAPAALPYQSSRSCITRSSDSSTSETAWSGPCYLGICLPHRLADLFPEDDDPPSKLFAKESENAAQETNIGADNSSGESETDTGTDTGGGGGTGTASSRKEVSSKRRHDRSNCLLCTSTRAANQRVSRLRKISTSSTHRIRTETESSYGAGGEGESPIMLPWQTKGGLEGVNSVDSSSTDVTSIAQRSLNENMKSRSMVRRDILKLADQLSSPILYKTCKQALLHLKQMYGDLFQDICVYSDVCQIIANQPHRLQSRRFLQELFLDIQFTELYEDSVALLSGGENGMDELEESDLLDPDCISLQADDYTGGVLLEAGGSTCVNNSRVKAVKQFSGFETGDQRSNPLLEVIPEQDTRSDSSEACRESVCRSLDLSDFSAPNSFDGDICSRGIEKLSLNESNSNSAHHNDKQFYLGGTRQSNITSDEKPIEKISKSMNGTRNTTSVQREILSKDKQEEAAKAKQLIEKSSSKISVLQESLKLSSSSSSSSTLTTSSMLKSNNNVGRSGSPESLHSQPKVERQDSTKLPMSTGIPPPSSSSVPKREFSKVEKGGAIPKTTPQQLPAKVPSKEDVIGGGRNEKRTNSNVKGVKSSSGKVIARQSSSTSPKIRTLSEGRLSATPSKRSSDDLSSGSSCELKTPAPISSGTVDNKSTTASPSSTVSSRQRKKATTMEPNRESLELGKK